MTIYNFPSFPRSMPRKEFYAARRAFRMMRDLPFGIWFGLEFMRPLRMRLDGLNLLQFKKSNPNNLREIIKWRIAGD